MQLSLQTFPQLLQRMCASVQSSASRLVDLSVGSMLRAILEANASIGLWIQWLIVQTLSMTRAATCVGPDLDSWMGDFMLRRQPAVAARGVATFSRLLTGQPLSIPAGTLVKAPTGNVSFSVGIDTTNTAWEPDTGSYNMPVGISAIDLPIVAQTPGPMGNVTAGAVSAIAAVVPGLDFVSNTLPLSGGSEAETDDKFRARFRDYINSRSKATPDAVAYAVMSLHQSMRLVQFENTDATGAWLPGHFLVVADDGSGQPSASVLSIIRGAIDKVRPIGSGFTVRAPDVLPVTISVSLASGGDPVSTSIQALIVNAVTAYVEQLPIGPTLSLTRIAEVVYRAGHLSQNIASVAINGANADLVSSPFSVLAIQSVSVQ
jgi:uncharacterized phage protein gp47/JayE